MIIIPVLIAMCCNLVVQAIPSYYQNKLQLVGVPDFSYFGNLGSQHLDIQDLGSEIKGPIPEKEIKVTRIIKISVPKPYPVKIPVKVPYPVKVDKPYPVEVTKLVHVPQPVPVEVIKNVEIPVEVPKPYPVPENSYNSQFSENGKNYEQQNWQPSSEGQSYNYYQNEQYNSNANYNSQYDQNGGYSAEAPVQKDYQQESDSNDTGVKESPPANH